MFDNLREQSSALPFEEEKAKFQPAAGTMAKPAARRRSRRLLGMTAFQRFVIALLMFFSVCSLGAMLLLITGKISL